MRIRPIKSISGCDYKAVLPALILSVFLLICITSENVTDSSVLSEGSQRVEQLTLLSVDFNPDGPKGMASNPVSDNEAMAWLPAVSLTGSIGKHTHRDNKRPLDFSSLFSNKKHRDCIKDRNTLSLVDAGLGSLFTLLGEKPSGTS
jgi:hypothetical protein